MYLIPVPAFADNELWLLQDGKQALVVDPGDAGRVPGTFKERDLQQESILVTHPFLRGQRTPIVAVAPDDKPICAAIRQ